MTQFGICTIFAKNYISYTRVLARSFHKYHPNGVFYALLCDKVDGHFTVSDEPYHVLTLEDLSISDLPTMAYQYDVVELSTAVKPFLLRHLFATTALDRLCYFDPDILFLSPIKEVFSLLDANNIVLLPHLTDIQAEDSIPSERQILTMGVYNLGFIGLRRNAETDKLLRWWENKLKDQCYVDPARGLYVDQRWIDLVPGMFDGVHIHRDPGCDIAYWNLPQRPIVRRGPVYTCLDQPVKFFHFSGYSPQDPTRVSKRVSASDTRLGMNKIGATAELFEQYRRLLLENDYSETSRWPYAFGHFANGVRVPRVARRLWRDATSARLHWDDPLDSANPTGFYQWLLQPVDGLTPVISRMAEKVYTGRPDLQRAFPDIYGIHRRDFVRWFTETGIKEHDIPIEFAHQMHTSLTATASPVARLLERMQPVLNYLRRSPLGKRILNSELALRTRRWLYR